MDQAPSAQNKQKFPNSTVVWGIIGGAAAFGIFFWILARYRANQRRARYQRSLMLLSDAHRAEAHSRRESPLPAPIPVHVYRLTRTDSWYRARRRAKERREAIELRLIRRDNSDSPVARPVTTSQIVDLQLGRLEGQDLVFLSPEPTIAIPRNVRLRANGGIYNGVFRVQHAQYEDDSIADVRSERYPSNQSTETLPAYPSPPPTYRSKLSENGETGNR